MRECDEGAEPTRKAERNAGSGHQSRNMRANDMQILERGGEMYHWTKTVY
jgi:hypothetical protein